MKLDLKGLYKQKIVPSLIEEFGYKNIEQVPKLIKISVNRGVGEASKNSKELDSSVDELSLIVGQQPTINKASKSVAGFKIRDGMAIGTSVTLRKEQIYNFLTTNVNFFFIGRSNYYRNTYFSKPKKRIASYLDFFKFTLNSFQRFCYFTFYG